MTGVMDIKTAEATIDPVPPSRVGAKPTPRWSAIFTGALANGPGGYPLVTRTEFS